MKKLTKPLVFHADGGHGWLAVKMQALIDLGILESISPFSYMKGSTVYLEEDMDAGTFIRAYTEKFGERPPMRESFKDRSPIRSYQHFEAHENWRDKAYAFLGLEAT